MLFAMSRGEYRVGSTDPVMIVELGVTSWCNYRCSYCVTTVHARRENALHAFDRHPVDAWVDAFARVPHELSLLCRGGEPFLDPQFGTFLAAVAATPKLRYVRVDTNGSWPTERFDMVPVEVRRRVQLNVSFHPTQIAFELFCRRVERLLAAGWQIAMINYVMEAGQADDYERVRDHFARAHDLYVNPNPDAFDPAWQSPAQIRRHGQDRLRVLLPAFDLARKTGEPTAGKSCAFPSIAYFIAPDGFAERACGYRAAGEPARIDFIHHPEQLRPLATSVTCPQPTCLCLDRYAFLDEADARGREIDLLGEYVRACRAHQSRPSTSSAPEGSRATESR